MSDESARTALRSDDPLVVIEAPAGCGKTYCGAEYAREVAQSNSCDRLLVATHTHAACSAFAERTRGIGSRVEIRTVDSVVAQIASAYRRGLGLPSDIGSWVRANNNRHAELALKVAKLLNCHPMIAASLAKRYRVVICDEHQDCSGDQHSILMSLHGQGAKLRVFGDPMQKIFRDAAAVGGTPAWGWDELCRQAQAFERLDHPYRWSNGCRDLGRWTLQAREALKFGGAVNLRGGLPASVVPLFAENTSQSFSDYRLLPRDRGQIDDFLGSSQGSLLILTRYPQTARSLRRFFYRRIQLWEGHVREALDKLVRQISTHAGDATFLASAIVEFMKGVAVGFTPTDFGNRFQQEVHDGCVKIARGRPVMLQDLARLLLAEPNHRGVAKVLNRIWELARDGGDFGNIKIDHFMEFSEAIRIGRFDTAEIGLAEITSHRTYTRPKPPERAISTIYKAKGLECENVILMPCDGNTFPNNYETRCLLYVALSRAKSRLMIVLSRQNASPLFVT